jgi:hypothetical protein
MTKRRRCRQTHLHDAHEWHSGYDAAGSAVTRRTLPKTWTASRLYAAYWCPGVKAQEPA